MDMTNDFLINYFICLFPFDTTDLYVLTALFNLHMNWRAINTQQRFRLKRTWRKSFIFFKTGQGKGWEAKLISVERVLLKKNPTKPTQRHLSFGKNIVWARLPACSNAGWPGMWVFSNQTERKKRTPTVRSSSTMYHFSRCDQTTEKQKQTIKGVP